MKVKVNDEVHELPESVSLQSLLAKLGMDTRPGLAVAVNDCVLPRASWSQRMLASGDAVLVIQATQGG